MEIEYDHRPFGNRAFDFVRLTKFYWEFDYVRLLNPMERLVFDWVRSDRTVRLDTPGVLTALSVKKNINVFNCFEDDIFSVDFLFYGKFRLAYFPRSESMIEQKFTKYGMGENQNTTRSAMRLCDITILGSPPTCFI